MPNLRLYLPLALLGSAGLLASCVVDPNIQPNPVPSAEKLRAADCAPAEESYRRLLQLPPRVGMVVATRRAAVRSVEEQAGAAQAFARQCPTALVGKIRRAILRCWLDAPDSETFQSCSQRF